MTVFLVLLILAPCVTIVSVAGAFVLLQIRSAPPRSIVEAKAALQTAELRTRKEMEEWKQDWILEQRRKNERPALPPGTQEVLPR